MSTQLNHYRLLGRSGLRVSPLCLGTMTFGVAENWGTDFAEAEKIFNAFVERGGNYLDTANFYSQGESERIIGELVKDKRERMVISTKYTLTLRPDDPNASGNHRKNMVRSVEDSLRRMQTDYIDLLYLHAWDSRTPVEEILRAFDDLVRAGKILYTGISDTPAWQVSRLQAIADIRGWSPLIALQIPYNLAEREVERELIPMAREMGIGVMPWSPLSGGILSGKYTEKDLLPIEKAANEPFIDTRKDMNVATGRLNQHTLAIANAAKTIASEMNRTPAQVALAWTLLNPAVTSTIIGVRTLAQCEDNLAALEVEFTDGQLARLEEASAIEMTFPQNFLSNPATAAMMLGNVIVEHPGDRR